MTEARRRQLEAGRRFWTGAARLLLVTAVATATAWAGMRINRPDHMSMIDPDIPDLLKRYVGDVSLDTNSLKEALDGLSAASGVRIEIDPTVYIRDLRAHTTRPGPPPAPLTIRRASLGLSLAAVLSQFNPPGLPLTYHIDDRRIVVGHFADVPSDPLIVRAYAMHDLLEQFDPWERRSPDVESALEEVITWHTSLIGDDGRCSWVGGYLVLHATPDDHRQAQRLLLMLRHARPLPPPAAATQPAATRDLAP